MNIRALILSMTVVGAAACGSSTNNTPNPPQDGGTNPGQDVGTGPGTDSGTPTTDRGPATTDRTSPRDTSAPPPAACAAVIPDLCTCGMNAACQQMAIGRNMACGMCLALAINACCPSEVQTLGTCAQNAGCGQNDQACWQRMCPMEFTALNTCYANGQMQAQATRMGACYDALNGCFGEFPVVCGGM